MQNDHRKLLTNESLVSDLMKKKKKNEKDV